MAKDKYRKELKKEPNSKALELGSFFRYAVIFLLVIGLGIWWFFGPEHGHIRGARAGYLKLTETSDYFHIQSDVYGIRIWKTNSFNFIDYFNASSTEIAEFAEGPVLRIASGTSYFAAYDTDRTTSLIENSSNRIVIKVKGKFDQTSGTGSDYLIDGTNELTYTLYVYIYPQYFTYKIDINAYNGVNLYNSWYASFLLLIKQENGYFDSGKRYYGTTTGEALADHQGIYDNVDYGAVLATSTVDWQIVKLSENHSGTSTFAYTFNTETSLQGVYAIYYNGNLKGEASVSLAVRPWTDSTAEQRRAWAAAMIGTDAPSLSVGAATKDWENEIYEPFNADGSYHLTADNNKVKFTLHGEADAYATLAATTTGGDTSLSIAGDSGLADGGGTTTHWVQIGNRLPYGSFDINDPDVLFYWDMDSATDGQAPNKGVGPISISGSPSTATGTAKNGINIDYGGKNIVIKSTNINKQKGSLGFWFKSNSLGDPYDDFFNDEGDSSLGFYLDTNATTTFRFYVGNSFVIFNNVTDVFDNEWHYIKVAWDDEDDIRKLYIDGKLQGKSTTAFSTDNIVFGNLKIGGWSGHLGIYDEFYISQDPDQPDEASYYDVVSYTDKNGSSLTGIPETGAGSIKWNHLPGAPVVQTTKPTPVFTIHDWHPKTKSTTTGEFVDHLVLDLPLDKTGSNENAGKVYDKVSGSWIGTTSAGVTFEQAVQGNGAKFDGNGEMIELEHSSNYLHSRGTIEFDFKMTSAYHQWRRFFSGGENYFELWREDDDTITFIINLNESQIDISTNIYDGQWHHIKVTWDDAADTKTLWIDGNFQGKATSTFSMPCTSDYFTKNFIIGNKAEEIARYLNGIIDNFRIYDDVILPYGAYYTGYEANGDYAHKHPDILAYINGDESDGENLKIGTGTVTIANGATSSIGVKGDNNGAVYVATGTDEFYIPFYSGNNMAESQGLISFWYKQGSTSPENNGVFYKHTSGYWYLERRNSNTDMAFFIGTSEVQCNSLSINVFDGSWHYLVVSWDSNSPFQRLYIDGVLECEATSAFTPYNISSGNLYFGRRPPTYNDRALGGYFDEIYITDDPNTPQIPTAYGKPIIAPQLVLVETNGNSLKTMETDYDVAMLNDITSWLVKYNADVDTETTFLITETLNPPSLAATDENLDRVAPLLSVSYTSGYAEITVQRGDGSWSDDFKLIFKEADAGISECYLGQGTAGSWGSNLCGATDMLTEISQNSVAQEDQTSTLNLVQSSGAEVIVRNYFTLGDEATTTEDWHIFSNGVVIKETNYTKGNGSNESRIVNSNFTNWTYYPATPSVSRGAGVYYDSFLLHLTSVNTSIQDDYLNPQAGATSTTAGFIADNYADIDADSYAESRGVYTLTANYTPDPSVPECPGTCGQPIYHTIGTSTATISATGTAVNQISADFWLVQFSSPLDLSGIHKHDKFHDSAGNDWNIVLVDDTNDTVVVGNQEKNSGSPATGAGTLGPWYNSLYAWEAAEQRDLTATTRYANGEIEMAKCWPLRDTTAVTINGWTTGENNFIKIYTPLSVRHKGKWTEDSYRLEVTTTGNYQNSLYIEEDYVIINGLQILLNTSYDIGQVALKLDNLTDNNTNITIKNNILKGNIFGAAGDGIGLYDPDSGGSIKIYNNIIYGFKTGIYSGYSPHSYIYNNTIYDCQNYGIRRTEGAIVIKNNLIASTTDPFNGTFAAGTDYNATDINDTPGVGDHNRVNQTFSFVDAANDDFHLTSSDTGARGQGWNLAADPNIAFAYDVDGEPRGGDWDIGADQVRDKWLNKVKFTFDASTQTIYQPRFLLQDFYPRSGKNGSEESYLLFYDPMDSITNGHEPKVGSGTVSVVGTTSLRYAVKGKGLYISTSTDGVFKINNSDLGISKDKGTASFYYIPNNSSEPNNMNLVRFSVGGGYTFNLYRRGENQGSNNNKITLTYGLAIYTSESPLEWVPGKEYLIKIAWYTDGDNSYKWVWRDNDLLIQVVDNKRITHSLSDYTYIGNGSGFTSGANGTIDEFKIYSEPILPFGAYYIGYEQNGNYSSADPTLTFYWDAEKSGSSASNIPSSKTITLNGAAKLSREAALVGNFGLDTVNLNDDASIPVSNNDIIDGRQGSVSMWVNIQALPNTWRYFFGYGDAANNRLLIGLNDQNYWRFFYTAGGINETINASFGPNANEWHYVRATWDSNEKIHLYVDGQEVGTPQDIVGTWQYSDGTIYLGAMENGGSGLDCWLDQIFITNSPYSQEIPTAFGKPLRAPLVKVDGVRQKFGYDYIVSWTPDPSAVIVQYFKNVTGTTFEIGEGEGTAQVIRLRGNIRLEGGVRF